MNEANVVGVSSMSILRTLVNAHFLLGGLAFGLVGILLARVSARTERLAWPLAWIVVAKYVSTLLVLMPLAVVFARFAPAWLGSNPLVRLPWLMVAFLVLAWALSTLVEWSFFYRAVGARVLVVSMRANATTLLLLVAIYLPFCDFGLLASKPLLPPAASSMRVLYLHDGSLFGRRLGGVEERLLTGLSFTQEARLFARRGEQGWELWLQDGAPVPHQLLANIAPITAEIPQQPALHVQGKKVLLTGEATLSQCFGKPAAALAQEQSAWSLRLGRWPWEGLEVTSRDLKASYRVALDTPLLSWNARCATHLPGERLLFQMGPYLWLLDLEDRRVSVFAQGQGAMVILGL